MPTPLPRAWPLSTPFLALTLAAPLLPQEPAQDGAGPPEASPVPPARELFLTHCASCHGSEGDGDGWTPLDRPARSFREGGFSFGNTPDALFRTISTGIPGTPMPGFDSALDEAQRRDLAAFVRTLGPTPVDAPAHGSELVVGASACVVRGCLPPIAEGLPLRPRGLLIGTPEGFTFEYRDDDVRLLGVRQGGFVERADWTGRGGSPLEPLGTVVWLAEGGDPLAPFSTADGPLRAALAATWTLGAEAGLEYRLTHGEDAAVVAEVRETPRVVRSEVGIGFARRFEITARRSVRLRVRAAAPVALERVRAEGSAEGSSASVLHWASEGDDGRVLWTCVRAPLGTLAPSAGAAGDPGATLALEAGGRAELEIESFVLPTWDPALAEGALGELVR